MTQRKGLREQHQRHAWGATSGPVVGHWRYPRGLLLATLAAGLLSAGCERNPADNLLRSPPADEPSATAGAPAGEPPASPLPNRGVVMEIGSATPVAGAFQGALFGVTADQMMSYHGPGFIPGYGGIAYPPRPGQQTVDPLQ